MARPYKPYQTTWGEIIPGLYRGTDKRWRIIATGERFREEDERRAVAKFRAQTTQEVVQGLPVNTRIFHDPEEGFWKSRMYIKSEVPAEEYWIWLREQLIKNPAYIARMVGIPEIANLARLALSGTEAIKLATLLQTYKVKGKAGLKAKRRAEQMWDRMTKITGATTLDELTTERLLAFKDEIERSVPGGGTKVNYYGRIKAVVGFGLKAGLDAVQIRAALDRCKVLWTSTPRPVVAPHPISRDDFQKLLAAAGDGPWRAWLLVGLNFCMHLDEVCKLKTAEINLQQGTYAAIRGKTADQRIPRAAIIWPETAAAIMTLPKKGPLYVFTSMYGTKYNRNSRGNDFAELRTKAGLPVTVKWDDIRDGAYTAAVQAPGVEEKYARVLAGHAAPGLQDNYVLRHPSITRSACEAVYHAYGPFPAPDGNAAT